MNEIAAGWYPDPENSAQLRWWDGQAWTGHVAPAYAEGAPGLATGATAGVADGAYAGGADAVAAQQATAHPFAGQAVAPKPRGPKIWNAGTWVTLGVCVALVIGGFVAAPMFVDHAKQAEAVEAQEVLDAFVEDAVAHDDAWRDSATPQFSNRVLVGSPISGDKATAEALDLKVETEVGELQLTANQWYADTPPTPQDSDLGMAPITITYTYTFDDKEYTASVDQVIWLARPFYYGDKKPAQYDFMKTPTAKGPWRVFRLSDVKDAPQGIDTTMTEQPISNISLYCEDGPAALDDISTELRVNGKFLSNCLYDGGENVAFDQDIDREDFIENVPAFDRFSGVGMPSEIMGIGDMIMGVQHMPLMEFAFKGAKATYVVTFALVEDETSGDTRAALIAVQRAAESREADSSQKDKKAEKSDTGGASDSSSEEGAE